MKQQTLIWDLATRLYHWSLVIALCVSLYTGFEGSMEAMEIHQYSGIFILSLLVFRIIWGVFGSYYSRFNQFILSPQKTILYLKGLINKTASSYFGHTPPGSWMAILIPVLVLTQTISGLFTSDGIFLEGPLSSMASDNTIDFFSAIHHRIYPYIIGLIVLHISAILFYKISRKENLTITMITGKKAVNAINEIKSQLLALLMFTLISFAAFYFILFR